MTDTTSQTTEARLRAALSTLIGHLDGCRQIERGAGGMTIDAQIGRRELLNARAAWVEEARAVLDEIEMEASNG